MDLKELQKNWNQFGKQDPLWAIITWDEKKGNKWDPDEFFETGRQEVKEVMHYVERLGLLRERGRALDFGCGVGRLTQALADYFQTVVGIDIAPSMVKLANQYNRFGARCTYYVNAADNLRLFADRQFHFIYTNIVLQHMKPDYAKSYIKEFLRVLKPEGVLIFQLPSRHLMPSEGVEASSESVSCPPTAVGSTGLKRFIKLHTPDWLWRWYADSKSAGRQPMLEMYGVERAEVETLLKDNGARLVDVVTDSFAGEKWEGFRYCVTKY